MINSLPQVSLHHTYICGFLVLHIPVNSIFISRCNSRKRGISPQIRMTMILHIFIKLLLLEQRIFHIVKFLQHLFDLVVVYLFRLWLWWILSTFSTGLMSPQLPVRALMASLELRCFSSKMFTYNEALKQNYFQVFQFEASKRNICIAVHEKVNYLQSIWEIICNNQINILNFMLENLLSVFKHSCNDCHIW